MPYATWENEDKRTGRMIVLPGQDHAHSKGQTACMICVSNQKDIMANRFWLETRKTARFLVAKIAVSMERMFDYGGRFPETKKKKTHAEERHDMRKAKARMDAKIKELTKKVMDEKT